MLNKITEMLGTTNTMTTAVTLAAGGYILNLLKAIPLSILRMIIKKVTKSVYVTSDNYEVFVMMENQIYKDYEDLFKNHISGDLNQIYGLDLKSFSIAPGIYTKIDWKNLSVINVTKFELNINNFGYNGTGKGPGPKAQLFKLGISAYGLHADNILDKYKALIKRANDGLVFDNDKFIKILEYSNPYEPNPIKYVGKKKRENIFDERTLDVVDRHLDKFINNEELYNKIGDIYKTGILLHGKPGTGKSCIAKYIAGKLDAMVYVWTNERMELSQLPNLRAMCKSKYIVVLMEEIDKMIKERGVTYYNIPGEVPKRGESPISEESLSMLLQTMDGIKSMDGIIFIATTNHIEHLPDSLIRKGRFDLVLEMNGIGKEDAVNMCNSFNISPDIALPEPDSNGLYNPAELRNNLLIESYNPGRSLK